MHLRVLAAVESVSELDYKIHMESCMLEFNLKSTTCTRRGGASITLAPRTSHMHLPLHHNPYWIKSTDLQLAQEFAW